MYVDDLSSEVIQAKYKMQPAYNSCAVVDQSCICLDNLFKHSKPILKL